MNRNLLLLLISFSVLNLSAQQGLEKRIPAEATFVISFNLGSLAQKVNFNDLGNYNFLKKPENEQSVQANSVLKELFRLPDKAGISRKGKLFIFPENHDSTNNLNYLISISDAKAFETRMTDILKTKQNEPKFKKDGKVKTLNHDHKMSISIAKDYALISIWTQPYYSVYDYDEYNEERNRVVQMIDSIRYANMPVDTTSYMEQEATPDTSSDIEDIPEENDDIPPPPDEMNNSAVPDSVVLVEETEYYNNGYDNDSLMKQFERRWVIKRKSREDMFWAVHDRKMTRHQKYVAELKPADGIASNAEFTKVFANKDDIIYWFHYETYSQQIISFMSEDYSYKYSYDTAALREKLKNQPPNKLAELLNNNSMYGLGNFNKGEIKMNFYSTFNDKIKPYIQKVYSNDINPEFFKYVKRDNLMGLVGMSLNTEAATNLYYEILRRAYESTAIPKKEAIAVIEITDIFLDKNVIHHTFKGDAVIAFTGIKSYLHNYTTYEYDSLTFENRTVEKTRTDYMPEFTAILTIENLTNLKRILNMIKRLEGLTEISENVYSFKSRKDEINGKFFVVIKDNLLFISNDKPLATEQIATGLSTDVTVGNDYKSYLNSSSFGFWDASKMFKLMAEGNNEKLGKPDELEKWSEKINKGFFVAKPMVGSVSTIEVSLEMKNRENSSLLELLKLFDDIYVLNNFRY